MTVAAALAACAASHRRSGLILAAMGAIGFSGKAIIAKLAYRHGVDAITVVMLRMLLALPMFVLLAWWAGRGKPALVARDFWAILGLGFCGYYLASTLDFAGLQFISASFERLILYLNPTLVLILGVVWFKHRVTGHQLFAMGLSYCGVVLVFGHELSAVGEHAVLGAGLVFASAVSYAVYLAFSGNEVKRLGAMRLTGWATAVACVLCILQFIVWRPMPLAAVPLPVWGLSLLNAVVCTFAPVLMVMMAIERVGATVTAQTGMIGPLSTILLGVVFLGEALNAWIVAGTVLVLAGVWWLAKSKPAS
jgi:drug/metabolite transporter (DMT)-like permease